MKKLKLEQIGANRSKQGEQGNFAIVAKFRYNSEIILIRATIGVLNQQNL